MININKTLSIVTLCGILGGTVNASDSTGVIPTGEPAAQPTAILTSATDTVKMLAEKFDSLETRLTHTIEDRFARNAELEARVAELEGLLRASDTRAADLAARLADSDTRAADLAARLADSEAEVATARCSEEAALAGRREVEAALAGRLEKEAAMRRRVEEIAASVAETLAAYQKTLL